jgi:hypothetical protein
LLKNVESEIIAKARVERSALDQLFHNIGLTKDNHQAVVDVGYGGSVQAYLNKLLSRKVHGYYLMTEDRAREVADKFSVILRACYFEAIQKSAFQPTMFRFSFEVEKLLSSDDPQIEFYEVDQAGALLEHFRDLTPEEIAVTGIRKQLQRGVMDFIQDACQIRDQMLPDFQPSCETARQLMDNFLSRQSQNEINLFKKIVLDDHYCGRGLVN